MKRKKVGVLFGGQSGEHEVSCRSAAAIIQNLDRERYEVIPIGIARSGRWYAPVLEDEVLTFNEADYADKEVTMLPKAGGLLYKLSDFSVIADIDVIFPIIHGTTGEDGRIQGFLDLCQIPYVGAGVCGSAVGMDKAIMRDILKAHNIKQVPYVVVLRHDWEMHPEQVIDEILSSLHWPIFVKPANLGSSVGISCAKDKASLKEALDLAARYDRKLMVEQGVEKREIELSVLGNNEIETSLPGEIFAANAFYDYNAKYLDTKSKTIVPADLPKETVGQLQAIGVETYQALDLCGMARIDFFIEEPSGDILLNEVNTLPGFTSISMYAQMWEAVGMDMKTLLSKLIDLAFDRAQDMARNDINLPKGE